MKRILITGANSYIGTSFEEYISKSSNEYEVDTLDMQDEKWKQHDFSQYDVVFHVAGIAHSDIGNVSEEEKAFYYKINSELTKETAEVAKKSGVKQFIFMSSAIVYGDSAPIGKTKMISAGSPLNPANFYGDSKVRAEKYLEDLRDSSFKVVILRPPMIYGPNSKGNYPIMSKMAQKLPVFPKVRNERSMLFVGNLVEFVRLMIDNEEDGVFFPQNEEYSNTSDLVRLIAQNHGKNILLLPGFTWLLKFLSYKTRLVTKAFGNLTYDKRLSQYKEEYAIYSLEESIRITESI